MGRHRGLQEIAALALVTVLGGCLGGGSGSGGGAGAGGGSAPWAGLFNVPNIYVLNGARTVDDVQVPRAVVFGDSYSVQDPTTPFPFRQWNEQAVQNGLFAQMTNYAVGGAEASSTPRSGRSLAQQVDRFLSQDRYSGRELTLVFIGFNDIRLARSLAEMDAAEADAAVQFDRLKAAGATDDERRVFLLLTPNYGRYPNVADRATRTQYTLDWANFLTDYGNANANFVPVDVYTFFERVFKDPGRWGLTNVTTPDPARAVGPNATALFYDSIHFGERGHALLTALVEHYLTQGWDWANTLTAGADTVAQLNQDIDAGLITAFGTTATVGEPFAFALGEGAGQPQDGRTGATAFTTNGRRGMGVGWRLGPGFGLALLQAEGTAARAWQDPRGEGRSRSRLRAGGLALLGEAGGLTWTTRLLWGREALQRSDFDALSASATRARFGADHLALGQRLSTRFAVGDVLLRPWIGLDWARRRIDGYAMADPYVGRVAFTPATISRTLGSAGIDLALPPLSLGVGQLQLAADLALVRELSDPTVTLRLRQGLMGHRERLQLARADALTLGLAAQLQLSDRTRLGLSYRFLESATGPAQHTATVRARILLGGS